MFGILVHYLYFAGRDGAFLHAHLGDGFYGRSLDDCLVRIYAIADKHDVPGLRALAANGLKHHQCLRPKSDFEKFMSTIRMIDELCNPNDTTLWQIVVLKADANIDWLVDNASFFSLVQKIPALQKALLKRSGLPDSSGGW